MIEGSELTVAAIDGTGPGLKRLLFERATVRALCSRLEAGGLMTIQAVAERIGLKWAVVANLVARGLLATVDGLVARAVADEFMAVHVTGAELAREHGTSPRALAAALARRGIKPVAGPGVDGSRLNIYRRLDISANVNRSG